MQSQWKTIQPQFKTKRKKDKQKYKWFRKVVFFIPLIWPLARSKLKGVHASVPGAGNYCAGCLSCLVAKAARYYLDLLRWDLGLPKLCTRLNFPCSFCIYWFFHFSTSFSGDVRGALGNGWPLQLSGKALWCSLLGQPSGAAFWCSSLLQLSDAPFCFAFAALWCTILLHLVQVPFWHPWCLKQALHLVMAGHY